MTLIPFDDNDIVDAELVEDGSAPEGFLVLAGAMDRTAEHCVPLDFEQRALIRMALAHYHNKGPRDRRTSVILALMNHMADHEPVTQCANCDGTGKVRDMYGMNFCYCPVGISRLSNEG